MLVKRNQFRKFERIANAADALCRNKEAQLADALRRLAAVKAYAEKLSSLDCTTNVTVSLLPDIWSAQLTKAFSEMARQDAAVASLVESLSLSRARRDNIVKRLRAERSRGQRINQEKDVEAYVNLSLHGRRIRLR